MFCSVPRQLPSNASRVWQLLMCPLTVCGHAAQALLSKHFNTKYEEVVPDERLIFGDYLVPGADPKVCRVKEQACHCSPWDS